MWEHASMAQVDARSVRPDRHAPALGSSAAAATGCSAGVAGGIGRHLGVDPNIVRVAFIGLVIRRGLRGRRLRADLAPRPARGRDRRRRAAAAGGSECRPGGRSLGIGLVAVGLLVVALDHRAVVRRRARVAGGAGRDRLRHPVGAQRRRGGRGRWTLSRLGTPLESVARRPVSLPRVLIGAS